MTFKRLSLALLLAAALFTTVGCRHNRCGSSRDSNADACRDF